MILKKYNPFLYVYEDCCWWHIWDASSLMDRSDDSSLLYCGAVRWRDPDRWVRRKRGACWVCPDQERYPLLSAGGDGSNRPGILPHICCTSPGSVTCMALHHPAVWEALTMRVWADGACVCGCVSCDGLTYHLSSYNFYRDIFGFCLIN